MACFSFAPAASAQEAAPAPREIARGTERIAITRDAWGVPSVRANSFAGVWHGMGFAAAEDRLWQMELFRRDALGKFAEIGLWRVLPAITREAALEHDAHMRRSLPAAADRARAMAWMKEDSIAALEAYRDGVNAAIAELRARNALPAQFARLGFEPAPWEAADSLAIWEALMLRSGRGAENSILALIIRQHLFEEHGRAEGMDVFNDMMVFDDPDSPTLVPRQDPSTLPGLTPTPPEMTNGLALANPPRELLEGGLAAIRRDWAIAEALGLPRGWAADALILGRRRTETRKSIFAAQLRAAPSETALFHEIRISGPGREDGAGPIDVRGAAVPGIPAIFAGAGARIAWAADLSRGGDASVFIEAFDESGQRRYALGAGWLSPVRREETIQAWREGGEPESIPVETFETIHGPPLAESGDGRLALTVRRSWRRENPGATSLDGFLDLASAASYDDFLDAASKMISSHLLFYADGAGNIGIQAAGLIASLDEKIDPRLPVYTAPGLFEWRGYLGFGQLPQTVNPQPGFIVNWDSKLAVKWHEPLGKFSPAARLRELVRESESASGEAARKALLEAARWDAAAAEFDPIFEDARQDRDVTANADAAKACAVLDDYSKTRGRGEPGEALFPEFLDQLYAAAFEDDCAAALAMRDEPMAERMLAGLSLRLFLPNAPRVLRRDYLGDDERDEVVARALASAWKAAEAKYGNDPAKWSGAAEADALDFGAAGKIENAGERGSFMFALELGDGADFRTILAPGQNESQGSPHFADQLALFQKGALKPAEAGSADARTPQ